MVYKNLMDEVDDSFQGISCRGKRVYIVLEVENDRRKAYNARGHLGKDEICNLLERRVSERGSRGNNR